MEFLTEFTIDENSIKDLLGLSPSLEKYEGVYFSYLVNHFFK